jgi:hypothetical protein
MTEEAKWKADPRRGSEYLEPRRSEIVNHLKKAADVAYYAIDEETAAGIERLKKAAGDKKASIAKTIENAETKPAMEIVRKYWNEDPDQMWKHFVYNMSENGKA